MYRKVNLLFLANYNLLVKMFFLLISVFLILGGIHLNNFFYSNVFLIFLCFLFLFLTRLIKGKIDLPKGIIEYEVFVVIFFLSLKWSKDFYISLYFLALFITGGLLWVIFYNYKKEFEKWIVILILFLGFLFLGLYLLNLIKGDLKYDSLSLYLSTTKNHNHNHLGDLWSLVLIVVFDNFFRKTTKKWLLVSALAGVYSQIISLSRSALISLAMGLVYLSGVRGLLRKKRFYLILVALLIFGVFLYTGINKSVLSSRPYFTQAIKSVVNNVYGVGFGNFGHVSLQSKDPYKEFSSYTHNIILEMFSGFGVWGVIFLLWVYKVFKEIYFEGKKGNYLHKALLLTLSVNFLFDFTYAIPTMLWLWFAFLGLSQSKHEK